MSVIREIHFYGNNLVEFYNQQDLSVQTKIEYVLDLVRFERQIPIKFFKKLDGTIDIYEVRIITSQKSIRILCFQEDRNLIILTNGFIKKTQKTPKKEIKLAEKLKIEYLKQKGDEKNNNIRRASPK
jgi:phage-related protein